MDKDKGFWWYLDVRKSLFFIEVSCVELLIL